VTDCINVVGPAGDAATLQRLVATSARCMPRNNGTGRALMPIPLACGVKRAMHRGETLAGR
jgi:hypothetical protein